MFWHGREYVVVLLKCMTEWTVVIAVLCIVMSAITSLSETVEAVLFLTMLLVIYLLLLFVSSLLRSEIRRWQDKPPPPLSGEYFIVAMSTLGLLFGASIGLFIGQFFD